MLAFFRSQRFYLDLAGLVTAAVLFVASTSAVEPYVEILAGIGSSLLFAALIDLFLALQDYLGSRRMQKFFGRELVRDKAVFAYPDFVMSDEVEAVLSSQNQQLLYKRPTSRYSDTTTHRIDVPRVVAGNDIDALLSVADLFDGAGARATVVDRDILDDPDRAFISFGLSSNDCTNLYLETESPLFSICPDGQGSEFVRLANGSEYRSDERRQYGIIVRHRPDADLAPDRRWFLVAGLGARGTRAAAFYLVKNWRSLLKRFGSEEDFVVIVSTGLGAGQMSTFKEVVLRSGV